MQTLWCGPKNVRSAAYITPIRHRACAPAAKPIKNISANGTRKQMSDVHWCDKETTGRLPWSLDGSTASSDEWILDADGEIIGKVFFVNDRDRQAFLSLVGHSKHE